MAVPMPLVESRACFSKLAKPFFPFLSKSTRALLKSSKDTLPSCMASFRSLALASGPSRAFASWSSWPGIAFCTDSHAWLSTFPEASIWLYCSRAFSWSCVLLPPASNASLNASEMLVASSSESHIGAIFCTMPVMAAVEVGSPSKAPEIFLMDAAASSALNPRFCITFGKLFIWSARLIAPVMLELMTSPALENTDWTMPEMAPNSAAATLVNLAPNRPPTAAPAAEPSTAPISPSTSLPVPAEPDATPSLS